MFTTAHPRLTEQQYLDLERGSLELKHDFYDGLMYTMAGGSLNHARVMSKLTLELSVPARNRNWAVLARDLRLYVAHGGLYTYPDVIVATGEPEFLDHREDTLLNPVLLAEVLSPSTERYDRGFKSLDASIHLASLDCRLDLTAIYPNASFPERELPR